MKIHHGGVILHDGALSGANGKLYIRDQNTLFCFDVKAE
jgi:hypothetical protein